MASVRTLYTANPHTFMEMLLESAAFIEKSRHDILQSKLDVLDSMENRISLLVGKLAAAPTAQAFMMFSYDVGTEEEEERQG